MQIKDYRQKIYYPDNQIVKNLFANSREFMLLRDFSEYIGFYHRYTTGEVFTENEWNPLKSERLIRFRDLSQSKKKYYDLKLFHKVGPNRPGIRRKNSNNRDEYFRYTAPKPIRRKLTPKEIDAGKTYRYFITKRNERDRVFFEISPEQASSYGKIDDGINQFLYEMINLPWKVDGPEYDIYEGDYIKISGVIDSNLRIIDRYSQKFRLLRQLLTNPRELTVYENVLPTREFFEPQNNNSLESNLIPQDIIREDVEEPSTHESSPRFGYAGTANQLPPSTPVVPRVLSGITPGIIDE